MASSKDVSIHWAIFSLIKIGQIYQRGGNQGISPFWKNFRQTFGSEDISQSCRPQQMCRVAIIFDIIGRLMKYFYCFDICPSYFLPWSGWTPYSRWRRPRWLWQSPWRESLGEGRQSWLSSGQLSCNHQYRGGQKISQGLWLPHFAAFRGGK